MERQNPAGTLVGVMDKDSSIAMGKVVRPVTTNRYTEPVPSMLDVWSIRLCREGTDRRRTRHTGRRVVSQIQPY